MARGREWVWLGRSTNYNGTARITENHLQLTCVSEEQFEGSDSSSSVFEIDKLLAK